MNKFRGTASLKHCFRCFQVVLEEASGDSDGHKQRGLRARAPASNLSPAQRGPAGSGAAAGDDAHARAAGQKRARPAGDYGEESEAEDLSDDGGSLQASDEPEEEADKAPRYAHYFEQMKPFYQQAFVETGNRKDCLTINQIVSALIVCGFAVANKKVVGVFLCKRAKLTRGERKIPSSQGKVIKETVYYGLAKKE